MSQADRRKSDPNPAQVLDVLRSVLQNMDTEDFGPWYRPQSVVFVGRYTGRVASPEDSDWLSLHGETEPLALLITMRDGNEYRLTLDVAVPDEGGGA